MNTQGQFESFAQRTLDEAMAERQAQLERYHTKRDIDPTTNTASTTSRATASADTSRHASKHTSATQQPIDGFFHQSETETKS
jgi:hypothetical protein